jgi:hypothetical protein
MFRKSIISLFMLIFIVMASTVSAGDPLLGGCYIDAPASVNEGQSFTVTMKCNNLLTVYGAEFGTTLTGQATTAATSYIPGTFTTSAVGGVVVGTNTIADYAVSRTGANIAVGNFTMGSYTATAASGITANGSATITVQNFKMSTIAGVPITGLLQASPNATVIINNLNISTLSGNVTISSDGSVTGIKDVALSLDGVAYNQAAVANTWHAFNIPLGASYTDLNVDAVADMVSHLACSKTYTLLDGANTAPAQIGTITLKAGDVVSVSGDTAINIQDATAIGAQFGSTSPTGEVDVNEDSIIDIYDLVHVGRNYGATQGTCS